MLAEGVVAAPMDVDLCLVLGAGWPFHLGGITPVPGPRGLRPSGCSGDGSCRRVWRASPPERLPRTRRGRRA